jgi:hypothetical protein
VEIDDDDVVCGGDVFVARAATATVDSSVRSPVKESPSGCVD